MSNRPPPERWHEKRKQKNEGIYEEIASDGCRNRALAEIISKHALLVV